MAKTGRMLRIFKTTMPSISTVLPNGKPIPFINGRYVSDNPYDVAILDQTVKDGHPHIYIDTNDFEVDEGLVDPMEALREKIIQEYIASQERAINPMNDFGETDQKLKLNVGNSSMIADAASGGSGLAMNARLVELQKSSAAVLSSLPKTTIQPVDTMKPADQLSAADEATAAANFKQAKSEEAAAALRLQIASMKPATPISLPAEKAEK